MEETASLAHKIRTAKVIKRKEEGSGYFTSEDTENLDRHFGYSWIHRCTILYKLEISSFVQTIMRFKRRMCMA
jgi:hypothetical protein